MRGAVFTDIDGTLTIDRQSSVLDDEALSSLKELVKHDYAVVMVSGNSLPVVRGLSLYLGLGGLAIGENGAVLFDGQSVVIECERCERMKDIAKVLVEKAGGFLVESWQNLFRLCDMALRWRGISEEDALRITQEILKETGNHWIEVTTSGYAIHIHPRGCGKDRGIKKMIKILGLSNGNIFCVGDAVSDLPMRRACPKLVAVGNADPELKSVADIVTTKPSGKGFAEFVDKILSLNP
jgi:phosphoglycolate phosphatase (TIGR01487 family)